MKKSLILFLCLALLAIALVACGEKTVNPSDPKTDVSVYKAKDYEKSTLKNQVSWEGINSFKSTREIAELYKTDKDAAIKEARQIAIDFFTYAKTATWIPADTWNFTHHDNGDNPDTMTGGQVYGGLPYVGLASSAIYRLMDFIDEETGVVNIYAAGGKEHELQKMFGNQCANGAYVGWCRFINSADYGGTPSMTLVRKFIPVGPYSYRADTQKWTTEYNTVQVCKDNGDQTMFQSYAALIPGDGVINFTSAGHVMMVVSDPVVVYKEGTTEIDGEQSYLFITDQHVNFSTYQHEDGDTCQTANYIERKFTFAQLASEKSGYIPFTYKEWLGEDPIETPEYTCSHTGETITVDQIYKTKFTSNYHIYDIYASIYNADGVEVAKIGTHSNGASEYKLQFTRVGITSVLWGDLNKLKPAEYEYTVKLYLQSGTGERPVLWEGKLAAGE